ncbi:BrnA antitoxin family protein [Salisaeta longa]|uniref:BrnA antitoxin family protein n=1 Tax=Salisaeta longa TaxID=503170 RepID=UPI0012F7FB36|nr:BrnA antitoxin family protein [Salisaeta longa]
MRYDLPQWARKVGAAPELHPARGMMCELLAPLPRKTIEKPDRRKRVLSRGTSEVLRRSFKRRSRPSDFAVVVGAFQHDEPGKMKAKDTTTVSADELEAMERRTDWEALAQQTDEDIHQAVANAPDAFLLDDDWFRNARLVTPSAKKKRITIRLDEDIVRYFKQGGRGYQRRINDVLKAFVLSKRFEHEEET